MGCFFHGCKCQPFRDLKTLGEDTLAERYEQTMLKIEQIANAGYTVNVMCKCQFDASKIVEMKPHLQAHPIVRNSPLYTRDALYGGRTEAMPVHYKIQEDAETIQYYDVMSLYPYICKYFKFPVGHPIIHVGDICKSIYTCPQMEGLIKCTVVPPTDLYHPVLPYRANKKILFWLCRTVSRSKTCESRVNISQTLKGLLLARGFWKKYGCLSERGIETWRFTKCMDIQLLSKLRHYAREGYLSGITIRF